MSTTNAPAGCTIPPEEIARLKALGCLNRRGTNSFNCRVITRNGKLSSAELSCVSDAAKRFGNGETTLTTRLCMEIQGVPYENIQPMRDYLAQFGLETGGTGAKVRPIVSCKGTTCQYGLLDSFALSSEIHELFYKGYETVKLPHKFKIAVGGCPNNCVKPNLNDVGIVGQRIPQINLDNCRGCGKCVIEAKCRAKIARVKDGKLFVNPDMCMRCGFCVGKCPFHTIEDGDYGFLVYIGGRWGKRSAHGQALDRIFTSKEEVLDIVEKCILLFRDQGIAGERFSDTIARLGFQNVQQQLFQDDLLLRKGEILGE